MDIVAKLRYLRIAPRKVRLVLDLIRGRDVQTAEAQLRSLPKRSSLELLKLLKSAEANAQHNFKLDPKTLVIKQAFADEGPKLKRYQPHAMGRATVILKRSSHVTIVLTPPAGKVVKPLVSKEAKPDREAKNEVKRPPSKPSVPRVTAKTATSTRRPEQRLSHPGEKAGKE